MRVTHWSVPIVVMLGPCLLACPAVGLAAGAAEPGYGESGAQQSAKPRRARSKAADAEESGDAASTEGKEPYIDPALLSGLTLRSIGPALASGRISDLVVVPGEEHVRYVAVASGGVWKTENAGTTWTPIFDKEGSYSVGCITLDPNDPKVVWVGTGENNSQRSVSWGDGVYKSRDGGTTWQNVGLANSEHIGRIVVDPRDSDVVWVAAQGPLWRAGGDRGLYKTEDGGETWKRVLHIDEHTGVNEVWIDPRDPDVLYASSYQRGRRVWTLIDGGPGSGIHKSSDGGATWQKLTNGLPSEDLGRIGLAVSPVDPDVVYAIVEASSEEARGVYRSSDAGSNWQRRSEYLSSSPQYYQELVPDPRDRDRVYSLDTYLMVSENGGKDWERVGQEQKHVDEHALWIDPENTDHLVSGNDGGVYESWDRGSTWSFSANLPITQFYKIAVDNDTPFYNVYGGTQDNYTFGCPTRTRAHYGITNEDCYVTVGGDGFQSRVDPENADIVYSQSQHGNLVRFDRRTGETLDIKPREEPGDDALRWNWDSPLIISPHSASRLYFGAQKLFRSDDRGNSWQAVSGDLTRDLDRDQLEIMGRLWSVDAVAKHASTSDYGNLTALTESPLLEGLLYVGSDDGLVHVLEPNAETGDGVAVWRAAAALPGVPELTYIASIEASQHDPSTVYVVANDHKRGNFRPYVLESTDRGLTWRSIASDLPDDSPAWVIEQDHVKSDLLFLGTETGVYATLDGGAHWTQLAAGMPRIAVRDLDLQRRENDLVVGTFGRGFYVLDDYSPLRAMSKTRLETETSVLFEARDAWLFVESRPLSDFLGHAHFRAPNPPYGATLTYYLKDDAKTLEAQRKAKESKLVEEGQPMSFPSNDELLAEEHERPPRVVVEVLDDEGTTVRRLDGPAKKGVQRVTWDLRHPAALPLPQDGDTGGDDEEPSGALVAPGRYHFRASLVAAGTATPLASAGAEASVPFEVVPLPGAVFPVRDREALAAFTRDVTRLQRAALGASSRLGELERTLEALRAALYRTPAADREALEMLDAFEARARALRRTLHGDAVLDRRFDSQPPSLLGRVRSLVGSLMASTAEHTETQERSYAAAAEQLALLLAELRALAAVDVPAFEERLEAAGAPWTPGRIPDFVP